jgi:hypothetical protein
VQKDNEAKEDVKEGLDKKERDSKTRKNIEEKKAKENAIRTIENPFKFRVIISFEVGPIFTGCIDNDEKAIILRTNQLSQLTENIDKQAIFIE